MAKKKQEIITFKADESLLKAMRGISNRSEFIRNAILASLDSVCPICKGTGILPPHQKAHLEDFLTDHLLEECEKCNELHFICSHKRKRPPGKGREKRVHSRGPNSTEHGYPSHEFTGGHGNHG